MADRKITQFENFTGEADNRTYFIIASGENAEPDTQNYRLDFVNLTDQVAKEMFDGPLPFSGNEQCVHFGIFDTGDDRCINIDISGDSKFSIKPDMGAFFKESLTVSGTLYAEGHTQGDTCYFNTLDGKESNIDDSWVKNTLHVAYGSSPNIMTNADGEEFRMNIMAGANGTQGGLYIDSRTRDGNENNVPLLQIDEGIAGGNDPCFVVNTAGNTAIGHKNPDVRLDVRGFPNTIGTNNEIVKITANSNADNIEHYLGFGVDAENERSWIRAYRNGSEEDLILQNVSTDDAFVGLGKIAPQAKLHVGGAAIIDGDLTVHGTTTTVNSTTVTVDDINIELGSTPAPTDTTAEGGGITLKGSTDKEFKWGAAADAWRSNVNLEVSHATAAKIDLIRTTAGGGVDGLELASVGDLANNINSRSGIIGLTTPQDGTAGATLRFTTVNGTTQYDTLFVKDGMVGIGSDDPGNRLEVKGGITLDDDGSTRGIWFGNKAASQVKGYIGGGIFAINDINANDFGISSSLGNNLVFGVGGDEKARIDKDGNVGIGTDDPKAKLHLSTSGTDGLRLGFDSQTYYHMIRPQGDSLYLGADDGNTGGAGADIRFNVKGNEKVRIDKDGNVGIGTVTPANNLVIKGSSNSGSTLSDAPPYMVIENTYDNYSKNNVFGGLAFTKTGSTNVNGSLSNGVRAGIIAFYDQDHDAIPTQTNSNVGLGLRFKTSPQNAGDSQHSMTIDGAGNVGIGTNDPDFKLDIEQKSGGVQLQIGRTDTNAGSAWIGADSTGFHLGLGEYGVQNGGGDVTTPNGLKIKTNGNVTVVNDIFDTAGNQFAKLNNIAAPVTASQTAQGTVKLFSNTKQPAGHTTNAVSATADRWYGIQFNNANQMLVNVPWEGSAVDPNGGLEETANGLAIKDYNSAYTDGALFVSDKKFKSSISKIKSPLSIVKSINGVKFKWNEKADKKVQGIEDVGIIAQEVEKVLPEAVTSNSKSELSVYYHKIIPVLLECIKDQQDQIESLGQRISDLENG